MLRPILTKPYRIHHPIPVQPVNPGTMKYIFLYLMLISALLVRGQIRCTAMPAAGHPAAVSGLQPQSGDARLADLEPGTSPVLRIAVVVHVLYQHPTQNLSDAQIISGIAALNRDMRRRNADSVQTPARFRKLAADMQLEFVLAATDPWGHPTSGIVRKATTVKEWNADDRIKLGARGGSDAWDTRSYLNIWIGNMPRTLGYSTAPGGAPAADGIVINTTAFGTLGKSGAYNMGRTLVHEAGHWLGLKHIWGDESCGDDGVADTPQQAGFTSGCPSGIISTCDNGTNGDMYMNFMDFTNDACMNLFTRGQKDRARALFAKGGARASLLTGRGLATPWAADAEPELAQAAAADAVSLQVYPNPANGYVIVTGPGNKKGRLEVRNLFGLPLFQATYLGQPIRINLQHWPAGVYQAALVVDGQTAMAKIVRASVQ